MRELNLTEMRAISGGLVDTITVYGQHLSFSISEFYIERALPHSGTSSDYADEYDAWQEAACMSALAESGEFDADAGAYHLEAEIKSQSDWNAREYAGIIYRTAADEVKVSDLARGETVAEASNDRPETNIPVPSDAVEILGTVHNHPDVGYSNSEDASNRNPSDGDWDAFHHIVNLGYAETSELRMYILGPDGTLRQFNANDESWHNADNPNTNAPNVTNNVDRTGC